MDERKKHGWAWWVAAGLLAVPVLYVASFGPACWAVGNGKIAARPISRIYRPVLVFCAKGIGRSIAVQYAAFWEHDSADRVVARLLDAAKLIKVGTHRTNMMHDTPQRHVWIDM